MVKTEQEIQKVVKAMTLMLLHSTITAFHEDPKVENTKEIKAEFTLLPGQSTSAESLMKCSLTCTNKDIFVPESGYVSKTLKDFVMKVREVFTSIHEYKKVLTNTEIGLPSEQDMDWVDAILKSYGVSKTKEYVVVVPLDDNKCITIGEIQYGEEALENMQLYIKEDYFIPKVEGLESIASREEDRDKLKPGLSFREV